MPFVLAANSGRSIALAARLADGWVTTGRRAGDVEAVLEAVAAELLSPLR